MHSSSDSSPPPLSSPLISQCQQQRFPCGDHRSSQSNAVRALKVKSKIRVSLTNLSCEGSFLNCCLEESQCPISNELMRDLIIVSTGQWYNSICLLQPLEALLTTSRDLSDPTSLASCCTTLLLPKTSAPISIQTNTFQPFFSKLECSLYLSDLH